MLLLSRTWWSTISAEWRSRSELPESKRECSQPNVAESPSWASADANTTESLARARDIAWRKVSVEGAREDYGVVVGHDGTADDAATQQLRAEMRAARTVWRTRGFICSTSPARSTREACRCSSTTSAG